MKVYRDPQLAEIILVVAVTNITGWEVDPVHTPYNRIYHMYHSKKIS